jgi:hypothetical protein
MTTWIERAPTFQPNNTLQKENARGRKRKRPWAQKKTPVGAKENARGERALSQSTWG